MTGIRNGNVLKITLALLLFVAMTLSFVPQTLFAASSSVGDRKTLGVYDQVKDSENKKEPLSWSVIGFRDGKVLLLCDKIIDVMAFDSKSNADWSSSSLRTWLNDTFYNSAFTDAEKKLIVKTRLSNTSLYKQLGSAATEDNVFVLSDAEIKTYLKDTKLAPGVPTDIAVANGLFTKTVSGTKYGYWWTRSTGIDSGHESYVEIDGSVYSSGCVANYKNYGGVRPAVWVDSKAAKLGGYTLTIDYRYPDGKTAAKTYQKAFSSGDVYEVASPKISGYTAEKTTVKGTMSEKDVKVTVTYFSNTKKKRTIEPPVVKVDASGKATVTAVASGDGKISYGFSKTNSSSSVASWQTSNTVSGLLGGTTYYFFAKITGSKTYTDAISASRKVTTEKATRKIDAPKIVSHTESSVCATQITPYGGGKVTYGVATSDNYSAVKTWKEYPVFNGLVAGGKYYVFAKAAETSNFKTAYSSVSVILESKLFGTIIPDIKTVTASTAQINPKKPVSGNAFYGITRKNSPDSVENWVTSTTFTGLEPQTLYYVFVKVENSPFYAKAEPSCCCFMTKSGERKITKPEVEKIEGTRVTIKKIASAGSDCVYYGIAFTDYYEDVIFWQTENVFRNLEEEADYYVFAKLTNGNEKEDLLSDPIGFVTGVAKDTPAEASEEPEETPTVKTARATVTPSASAVASATASDAQKDSGMPGWLIAAIVILAVVALCALGYAGYVFYRKKKNEKEEES